MVKSGSNDSYQKHKNYIYHKMTIKNFVFSLLIILVARDPMAYSGCSSLSKGKITLKVNSCTVPNIQPSMIKNREYQRKFVKMDKIERRRLRVMYKGITIDGLVLKSAVQKTGALDTELDLQGQKISIFLTKKKVACNLLVGKIIESYLEEGCCDGHINPPCLFESHYLFNRKIFYSTKPSIPDFKSLRLKENKSKIVREANKQLKKNNFKKAALLYEKANRLNQLGIRGHYYLGVSYRLLDQCDKAVKPLEFIRKKDLKRENIKIEDLAIKQGVLLLARCYSRLLKPDQAVNVLNNLLYEPKRFKTQIKSSLSHSDFGWIHQEKSYIEYKQRAEEIIGR